ncbi:MAG: hypothetical protein HRT58_13045 [Crocinitomicaceae bacterium]|nr:hypothetical protein [Flavobacteriales bacterium]NQZ36592.1 hypothetical protein [Crocinitomicaceae bacterium]PHR26745.1 MAG: hypothetical protein COA38_14265 [Fluviicola sp.]
MSTPVETDWTRPEFKAYLLTYAAKADYIESLEEKEIIQQLVSPSEYRRIHKEIDKDNDYQSLQKIMYNLKKFNYSKDELDKLMDDIKNLFLSDGEYDLLEQNMYHSLKRLLS